MGEVWEASGSGRARAVVVLAVVCAGLLASGCASLGDMAPAESLFASSKPAESGTGDAAAAPQSELQKATDYWRKQYSENPTDLDKALNYARNLKALGQKQQALGVLQAVSMFHANDRKLNSEYGRLALELNQLTVAKKLLEAADDPVNPDWRVMSARGTILAKEGKYAEAIPLYERALEISPNQTSVLNNLALAYAMNGEAARAEDVLRRIAHSDGSNAKVRQNLALVLGLQGKYEEATKVGSESGSAEHAAQNTDIIKKIVRLEGKPFAPIPAGGGTWEATVAGAASDDATTWQTKVAVVRPRETPAPAPAVAAAVPPPAAAAVTDAGAPVLKPSAR